MTFYEIKGPQKFCILSFESLNIRKDLMDGVLAENKSFLIDVSRCDYCEYSPVCRKEDTMRFPEFAQQKSLENYLLQSAERATP